MQRVRVRLRACACCAPLRACCDLACALAYPSYCTNSRILRTKQMGESLAQVALKQEALGEQNLLLLIERDTLKEQLAKVTEERDEARAKLLDVPSHGDVTTPMAKAATMIQVRCWNSESTTRLQWLCQSHMHVAHMNFHHLVFTLLIGLCEVALLCDALL